MEKRFFIVKLISIVVAIISTTLGCYSHYSSTWVKQIEIHLAGKTYHIKMSKLCSQEELDYLWGDKKCPTLFLETFFITIVIINLVGSVISAILTGVGRTETSIIAQAIDVLFHTVRSLFLLIGGPLYIWSADMIKDLWGTDEEFNKNNPGFTAHFRYTEKLAAGGVAIVQGILYAAIVGLAIRNRMKYPTKKWF